jgi:ubiquinone biosynthesis protein COQ9
MTKMNKDKLLKNLLSNVEQLNFSRIKDLDFVRKDKQLRYFDDKEISIMIIEYFLEQNKASIQKQSTKVKKINRTTLKIHSLLSHQLHKDLKHKDFFKKVFMFLSLEKNFPTILDYFFSMSSNMWSVAGDTSTDINYYSKRVILCTVYSKIFIKLITVHNYDASMIEEDIHNELNKVKKFNELKSKILSPDILSVFKKFSPSSNKKEGRGF